MDSSGATKKNNSKQIAAIALLVFGTVMFIMITVGFLVSLINRRTGAMASTAQFGAGGGSLSCPPGINTADVGACLDNWLAKNAPKDSPFVTQKLGTAFATAGQQYNVNPAFLIAIGGNESTFATVFRSDPKENNNYQNMKCEAGRRFSPETECNGTWAKYPSWEKAIYEHAKYLRGYYLDTGKSTIEEVRQVYCPEMPACSTWTKEITQNFSSITSSCSALSATSALATPGGNTIILDPGHGSADDRGFLGPKTEGGNNWDMVNRVKAILEVKGYKVALTKNSAADNPSLPQRVATANGLNGTIFVSLHSNSGGGSGPVGIVYCRHPDIIDNDGTVQYKDDNTCPSSDLTSRSKTISHNIVNSIKNSSLGLSHTTFWGSDLGVLNGLKMPGALIEMFFHDSQSDLNKVTGKEDILAQSIADGIMQTMGGK